jgi:hypothetical protein
MGWGRRLARGCCTDHALERHYGRSSEDGALHAFPAREVEGELLSSYRVSRTPIRLRRDDPRVFLAEMDIGSERE